MHISPCLNPQRVYNKYLQEYIIVPCGKCKACRSALAKRWIARLEQERQCWKYCVFFTLTYDEEHVPTLYKHGSCWCDCSTVHVKDETVSIFDDDIDHDPKSDSWLSRQKVLRYLSPYDAQCFIKRYRINMLRYLKSLNIADYAKKSQVRYFLCGEYGSTTKRPHYHGLFFFSSKEQAAHVAEIISKSWKFGIVDSSFVTDCNASYVASYVNSLHNLPSILRHRRIRPFQLVSRRPPLGTLFANSEETQRLFFEGSTDFVVFDKRTSSLATVPLWRSITDRLYPKISRFNEIDHSDRVRIYESVGNYAQGPQSFLEWCSSRKHSKFFEYYLGLISDGFNPDKNGVLLSLYYKCRRVYLQSQIFNISIDSYVRRIDEFYQKVRSLSISSMYDYQESSDFPKELVNMYSEFLYDVKDLAYDDVSDYERNILLSFDVDLDKFFSDDLSEREVYQNSIGLESTHDYAQLHVMSEKWSRDKSRTKFKNDYLAAHPELQVLVY